LVRGTALATNLSPSFITSRRDIALYDGLIVQGGT
jgi:hypothetical protein